jgi:hypothetical protein
MKMMTFIKLSLFIFLTSENPNFTNFVNYISTQFRPSESVKRNCAWQYAIVKVETNKNGIVTKYAVENIVSDEFKKNLNFIIGYTFKEKSTMKNRNLVFFLNLENKRTDACDVTPTNSHEPPDQVFMKYKRQHKVTDPKYVYVEDIITIVIYDPVY